MIAWGPLITAVVIIVFVVCFANWLYREPQNSGFRWHFEPEERIFGADIEGKDIRFGEDSEDEALRLYGYRKPSWCTCVFARNMELRPCIKCGALPPFIYESVSGFQTKGPLCPACHDEIDDCSPEHGETDERTPWPKEANLQAGGTISKETLRDLRWLYSVANDRAKVDDHRNS